MNRTECLKELTSYIGAMSDDELEILTLIASRIDGGRSTYGALDMATDKRVPAKELLEEVLDTMPYAAWALLKLRSHGDSEVATQPDNAIPESP